MLHGIACSKNVREFRHSYSSSSSFLLLPFFLSFFPTFFLHFFLSFIFGVLLFVLFFVLFVCLFVRLHVLFVPLIAFCCCFFCLRQYIYFERVFELKVLYFCFVFVFECAETAI